MGRACVSDRFPLARTVEFLIVVLNRPADVAAPPLCAEARMPLIEIHLLEGRTAEQKRALLESVTRAVQDSIDAPLPSIRAWIQEFAPSEYMVAGELAADRK